MSDARWWIALGVAGWSAACAAKAAIPPSAAMREGAEQIEAAQPKPSYERILGSFAVSPETAVLLDPAMCERHLDPEVRADGLFHIAARFERAADPRGEASARVNLGAVLWYSGDAEGAYRETMRALNLFAELGDVDGLAHTYEWLGWFFRESGAVDRAAEHLALSRQLYEMLGNGGAAERVLSYGSD